MLTYHPDIFDPFHALKYEQFMRQKQHYLAEQRRLREAELFLRERELQKEEAFRRNQAELHRQRQLQQQQQPIRHGYQMVQDSDGQLYLMNVGQHTPPRSRDNDFVECYSTGSEDDESTTSIYEDAIQSESFKSTQKPNQKVISIPITTNDTATLASNTPAEAMHNRNRSVIVEDVSDNEEDEDVTSKLNKTLRNRRPSPGQWLEPVESFF